MCLDHLFRLYFGSFFVEVYFDEIAVVPKESIESRIAAPNSVVRIEYFVISSIEGFCGVPVFDILV